MCDLDAAHGILHITGLPVFFFGLFIFFRATRVAYGGSQARG